MCKESVVNDAELECKDLSVSDESTNHYDRRYFQKFIEAELSRSRRYYRSFSLCFIEVDYMNQYNDAHGRTQGKNLLHFLDDLLRTSIRSSDLTCRCDEEEFVLLLPETSKAGASTVAEKMRRTVEVYPFEGRESQPNGSVTVSVGIACFPDDGLACAELVDNGIEALRHAKHNGTNRVFE